MDKIRHFHLEKKLQQTSCNFHYQLSINFPPLYLMDELFLAPMDTLQRLLRGTNKKERETVEVEGSNWPRDIHRFCHSSFTDLSPFFPIKGIFMYLDLLSINIRYLLNHPQKLYSALRLFYGSIKISSQ